MSATRCAVLALALVTAAPSGWAADATPDQAQALERQVREWIGGVLGPAVRSPDRPVQITPEGDHYAVAVPLGSAVDAPLLTATARMTDGGRWTIDDIRLPSPAVLKLNLPEPGRNDGHAPLTLVPVTYQVSIGQQAGQILFDPSYATQSTLTSSMQNLDLEAQGLAMQQSSHLDRSSTSSILRPAAQGRLDLLTDSTIEGYRVSTKTDDTELLKIAMGRVRLTGELDGVSRDRGVQILQALIQLGTLLQTASAGAPGGAAQPKLDDRALQTVLEAIGDFASGLSVDETVEKLSVSYGDYGGSLNQARLGLVAKSDGGLLQARLDLALEGPSLPDLPLGDMAVLVPSRVALRPAVTGIPVAELMQLARSVQNGGAPAPAEIAALFSHGGIAAGLESFAVDVAGAGFTGMGKLLFTAPDAFSGTAQITATNLDLLQQRVAANPQLAGALPVFIFAKGIGRTVENRTVWDVTYRNDRLLVNNQDLTAMMGGPAPTPAPDQGAPKSPPRPSRPPNRTR